MGQRWQILIRRLRKNFQLSELLRKRRPCPSILMRWIMQMCHLACWLRRCVALPNAWFWQDVLLFLVQCLHFFISVLYHHNARDEQTTLNIWRSIIFVTLHKIITIAITWKHFGVKYSSMVEAKRLTLAVMKEVN